MTDLEALKVVIGDALNMLEEDNRAHTQILLLAAVEMLDHLIAMGPRD